MKMYNENNFEADKVASLNKSLADHIENERNLALLIKKFLESARVNNTDQIYEPLLNLLKKINLNLEAVNLITSLLSEDYRFKTSVNLLYRAIIDDSVTFLYLVAFKEESETAYKNELSILERDYVDSVFDILEAVNNTHKYLKTISDREHLPTINLEEAYHVIKSDNQNLFSTKVTKITGTTASDLRKTLKSNSELRTEFSQYFESNFKGAKLQEGKLIGTTKKIKFIELRKYPHAAILRSLNKYFTQFFHFSPKTSVLVLNDIEFDLRLYYLSHLQVLNVLKIMVKVLNLNDTFDSEVNDFIKRINPI